MQKTRDVVFHENFIFPKYFLVMPRLGVKRLATPCRLYFMVCHVLHSPPFLNVV